MRPELAPEPINPFAFPSETNARYLLLIVAVAGTTLILADGVIGGLSQTQEYLPSFLAALGITAGVFWRSRRLARQDAQQRIRHRGWQPFPPSATGEKQLSLHAMEHYIEAVVTQLPGVKEDPPQLMWDDVSASSDRPTGIAFGFSQRKYVCLRQGLHRAFLKAHQSPQFDAILLHEFGHIRNQDVDKTILSLTLGRNFFPVALILLGLLNLYVSWSIVKNILTQGSLQPVWDGLPFVILINVKTAVLMGLVDVILSSVLRVREFYADARAREWLGKPSAFFQLFAVNATRPAQATTNPAFSLWHRCKSWYERLTLKHPTHRQRITALQHPDELYRPSREVALISGVLSGLVLNSCIHFLGVGLNELFPLTAALNQFAQGLTASYDNLGLIRLVLVLFNIIIAAILSAIVALLFGAGVLPLIGTLGLQIQGAAFADRVKSEAHEFVATRQLAVLAFIGGAGFVVGCLLVPVPKAMSLSGVSPGVLLGIVLLWTVTLGLWLWPLARLSGALYHLHTGPQEPRRKRQFLSRLSALALLPAFVMSTVAHVGLSVKDTNPELIPVDGLGLILGSLVVMGFILQGAVWGLGWMLMQGYGWFKQPSCPACKTPARQPLSPSATCASCGTLLSEWMRLPAPIEMPSPLAPQPVSLTAPPL